MILLTKQVGKQHSCHDNFDEWWERNSRRFTFHTVKRRVLKMMERFWNYWGKEETQWLSTIFRSSSQWKEIQGSGNLDNLFNTKFDPLAKFGKKLLARFLHLTVNGICLFWQLNGIWGGGNTLLISQKLQKVWLWNFYHVLVPIRRYKIDFFWHIWPGL